MPSSYFMLPKLSVTRNQAFLFLRWRDNPLHLLDFFFCYNDTSKLWWNYSCFRTMPHMNFWYMWKIKELIVGILRRKPCYFKSCHCWHGITRITTYVLRFQQISYHIARRTCCFSFDTTYINHQLIILFMYTNIGWRNENKTLQLNMAWKVNS